MAEHRYLMTPEMCRRARDLLGLQTPAIATKQLLGWVHGDTIANYERGGPYVVKSIWRVHEAFEAAGVELLFPDDGRGAIVRLRQAAQASAHMPLV